MAGEPILIVDDNAVNLKLMRVLLTGEGYTVRTAKDAEEALAVLKEFRPRRDEGKALEAGCDGYITKPVDTRTLAATIAAHLEKDRG